MTDPLLELAGVRAGYGDVKVLHDISLAIGEGTITAIIGSNGAGKTTLMRAISGLIPTGSGSIEYLRNDITRTRTSARVELGISLIPEGRLIFGDFSVEENLVIGAFASRVRRARERNLARLYGLFPRLKERRHQKGGTLSGGEQQMLAIARGLMSEPRLLLLDEPSLGLAPMIVRQLFETILDIRRSGITVMIVEQNVRATLEIADRAFVLENGAVVLSGDGRDLLEDPKVKQAYLGL